MRKPKVFLSHSKQDKEIIERLANDLRRARIDVWYDEWEIPPGESFRKKIFEDGIPACDLFFIYLTENSIKSVWVSRELDAAYIHDMNSKNSNGFLSIFVSSDELRASLALDIQALHSPVLNEENYSTSLMNIISKTWESTARKLIQEESQKNTYNILSLEKKILELENRLLRTNSQIGSIDPAQIITTLENKMYTYNNVSHSLKDIFIELTNLLAAGTNDGHFKYRVQQMFGISGYSSDIYGYEFLGELIILNLVSRESPQGDNEESYSLTELGKDIASQFRI